MLRVALTNRRGLDRGNASPETVAADFARFDLDIWSTAHAHATQTVTRRIRAEQLNTWRNAIAHQDFVFSAQQQALLTDTSITPPWTRRFRSACSGRARTFDAVVGDHVAAVAGTRPW